MGSSRHHLLTSPLSLRLKTTRSPSSRTAPFGPRATITGVNSVTGLTPPGTLPPRPDRPPTGPTSPRVTDTRWLSSRAALNPRPHLYLLHLAGVCGTCRGTARNDAHPAPTPDIKATVVVRIEEKQAEYAALEAKAQAMAKAMVEATDQAVPTDASVPPTPDLHSGNLTALASRPCGVVDFHSLTPSPALGTLAPRRVFDREFHAVVSCT